MLDDLILFIKRKFSFENFFLGTVWSEIFSEKYQEKTQWASVYFDNKIFFGWIEFFSSSNKNPEILLRDVIIYDNDFNELNKKGAIYFNIPNNSNIRIDFENIKYKEKDYIALKDEEI